MSKKPRLNFAKPRQLPNFAEASFDDLQHSRQHRVDMCGHRHFLGAGARIRDCRRGLRATSCRNCRHGRRSRSFMLISRCTQIPAKIENVFLLVGFGFGARPSDEGGILAVVFLHVRVPVVPQVQGGLKRCGCEAAGASIHTNLRRSTLYRQSSVHCGGGSRGRRRSRGSLCKSSLKMAFPVVPDALDDGAGFWFWVKPAHEPSKLRSPILWVPVTRSGKPDCSMRRITAAASAHSQRDSNIAPPFAGQPNGHRMRLMKFAAEHQRTDGAGLLGDRSPTF